MAQRSKITIFNAALTRTGNSTTSEGEGSSIWQALESNYDDIVRAAFEDGEYPFGKARETLTSRAAGRFGYDDAFTFPLKFIHITDVFLSGNRASDLGEAWDIDATTRELMIDASSRTVEIEGIREGQEYTWSGKFAQGVQRRLEAVIKDVEEEAEESSAKDSEADFQFMKAGVNGSKNRSRRKFRGGGRLTRAHRGAGRH
tara:strand:- start:915 stop:1517 length:603 start_codon:yes stop_codon:yes gene_type:complete